jgi:hypothetical protein
MKFMIKMALLAGVASLTVGAASAQQTDMPPFMKELQGVTYQGQVAGMDLYSMDGFEGLWMVSSDGRTAIAGTVFSSDGRDVGSVYSGTDAVRIFELQANQTSNAADDAGISMMDPDSVFAPDAPEKVLTDEEMANMEAGVSRIEGDIFGEQVAEESVANNEAPTESVSSDPAVAVSATKDAQDALEGLSKEDKDFLMAALVELLKEVKSETEFKAAVKVWTDEIVRRHRDGLEAGDGTQEQSAVTVQEDVKSAEASQVKPAEPDVQATVQPTEAAKEPAAEISLADQLLIEMRHDAFWFGIGNHEAPVVYAFIDPTCPYCSKAIVSLGDEVSEGRIQLRVALAPVVNRSAPGIITAILEHAEPPIAFMEHEYSWASGRTDLTPGNWDDLPGQMRDGLLHNVDIMKKYEIPGVPFFIFDTADGARIINGVPTPDMVSTAINDTFNGKSQ